MELISLQQHDEQWKLMFKNEKELLSTTLGKEIDYIHHVGSTAVRDILAKPIIDIAIEAPIYPPSQAIGAKQEYLDVPGLQRDLPENLIYIFAEQTLKL